MQDTFGPSFDHYHQQSSLSPALAVRDTYLETSTTLNTQLGLYHRVTNLDTSVGDAQSLTSCVETIQTPLTERVPDFAAANHGLGKVFTNRQRSASRSMPCPRNRSETLFVRSERADYPGQPNDTFTSCRTSRAPWPTDGAASTVPNLVDVAAPLRRTISNASLTIRKKNPTTSRQLTLSRARHNATLLTRVHSRPDLVDQAKVHQDLTKLAQEIHSCTGNFHEKAKRAWVEKWLTLSYMYPAHNAAVSRQRLYNSYTLSCQDYGQLPITAATFGKIVKSVFPGIQSRRFGGRGHSKFHYISLAPAVLTEKERLSPFNDVGSASMTSTISTKSGANRSSSVRQRAISVDGPCQRPCKTLLRRHTTAATGHLVPHTASFHSDPSPVSSLSESPDINTRTDIVDPILEKSSTAAFWDAFRQHQVVLVECIKGYQFDKFEVDHIVGILLSRLMTPCPRSTQGSLRQLADNLESIMLESLHKFPPEFGDTKIELAARAAHTIAKLETVLAEFRRWLTRIESRSSKDGLPIQSLSEWVDDTFRSVQDTAPWLTFSAIVRRVGFVTSQVLRDLTLKSDQAFGSFQLLKTWIDDWVTITAIRKTALLTGSVGSANHEGNATPSMETLFPSEGHVSDAMQLPRQLFGPRSERLDQLEFDVVRSSYLSA
ncbi:hypothetical protein IAR55_004996 [Kwoniella newhampshirensis]|uniref:RFX-type winged-helix domain-containing protein n=1 Tax=Kwoniella newhampshirensis TaxID=1651941 RepID=A0AAW0YJQ3_9TREE